MLKKLTTLTALISCSLFAQELVQNGRFDKSISNGNVPAEWQDTTKSWSQIDNDGADDTNAISLNVEKNSKGVLQQTVKCKGKTAYILSAFFKNEGAAPAVRILDAKGKQIAILKAPAEKRLRDGTRSQKVRQSSAAEE